MEFLCTTVPRYAVIAVRNLTHNPIEMELGLWSSPEITRLLTRATKWQDKEVGYPYLHAYGDTSHPEARLFGDGEKKRYFANPCLEIFLKSTFQASSPYYFWIYRETTVDGRSFLMPVDRLDVALAYLGCGAPTPQGGFAVPQYSGKPLAAYQQCLWKNGKSLAQDVVTDII
ncbi:hypothetical protein BS17DRAFT_781740 [Gyrodon lividus]|nr:hypothetical protein BS17DRAFT_781740 [Gyrodon lividus]